MVKELSVQHQEYMIIYSYILDYGCNERIPINDSEFLSTFTLFRKKWPSIPNEGNMESCHTSYHKSKK
jgi:hypothetical protein